MRDGHEKSLAAFRQNSEPGWNHKTNSASYLIFFFLFGWKIIKHLVDRLLQLLFVLAASIGNRLAGCASPYQLLAAGFVHIQYQRANFVSLHGSVCLSSTKMPPAPAWPQSFIERLVLLFIVR